MITAHHLYTLKKVTFTLLAVLLSAFLFVILVTYTPNDPSWSRISSDMGQVSNMGGSVGAWLSDLLYTFLGWPAWWLMAFLAYEAICLWWSRDQAFGPLRAISYVFLVLASCGLTALTPQLIGYSTDNGARFGGILGAEVATRLASLLTIYGAAVFLLVFSLITVTFAFDIRWKRVFKQLFSLSWLGSGIQRDSVKKEQLVDDSQDLTEEELLASQQALDETDNSQTDSPLFQQLKLSLPESSEEQDIDAQLEQPDTVQKSDPALSNVLDDFLVNSGLTESILALHEQEAQQQTESAKAQQAQAETSPQPSMTVAAKKQEPSFAWNDQDVINELLDEQALPEVVANNPEASSSSAVQSEVSETQPTKPADETFAETTAKETAQIESVEETIEDVDGFESIATIESETQQSETVADIEVEAEEVEQPEPMVADIDAVEQVDFDTLDEPIIQEEWSTQQDDAQLELDEEIDLTPTNTPPSNPKKPHEPSKEDSSAPARPTIRFATPEGDASNHIEDMVPDIDDEMDEQGEVSLPEIHDDSAFASSSRAMQTAKYRESLSPIPELSILDKPDPDRKPSYTEAELKQLSELLEIKLQEFNVKAEVVNAIPGPVVTRFEVDLAAGVKASKVTGISRDLARSLSMASLRVVEVIPGKPYIGIEVPNKKREMVRLIELLQTEDYKNPKAQISMAMGKDIGGKPIITDLARAPHMLVAGTTGSGKSVLVNAMLLSMLLKYKPSELRLILIDPKQLELANYNDIPHLLTPVVTDMNEAASSLAWCVAEMERRYQLMSLLKVRKLSEFNKKVIAAEKAGRPMLDPLWRPNDSVSIDKAPKLKTLPMIVIVADEFADMIMQVGKQAEELITRLAQKSRAAGIHLMLATQRPSVDVITGLIKANIPVRAALRVNSKVDSRTILDAGGAEDMLGNGDMLFLGPGQIEPDRVHGAYVSDEEVNRVCDAWRERGAPDYIDNMASNFDLTSPSSSGSGNTSGEDDALYDEAVAFVMETRKVSASSIQRKFSIGYNRAARIVDSMEEAGLVSAMGKSGKRELLM
ncbi:DNA translocase FtsK [Psychrobacter phenylpyruvicus]|uniref:DNA translocase FtsK n=1 Tax=Psychrobacter phenylpyruvicus TaxID=29432 RepID=A0A379LNM1_9GAMM|nr:DNA translocase FtsK 4TM domain-containing protein [Psychrobacter phenylpyruvicus]SUD91392.1 DNA translocase FtsK [Psychrobacter phenylpyruvicus]